MRPPESFIAQPIRSLQSMLRVISEIDKRIPTVVPDGIYGSTTQQAVTAFQRQHGLPATGVADQYTWEAVVASYEDAIIRIGKAEPIEIIMDPGEVFRRGDNSPYIYLLQGQRKRTHHLRYGHPHRAGLHLLWKCGMAPLLRLRRPRRKVTENQTNF